LSPSTLILATRRSALALQQSSWVKAELESLTPGLRVELLTLGTTGDRMQQQPLPSIGGKGLFTLELEEALLDGRAHFAVHSLKDLPTELGSGLTLAAVPRREDPRDVLITRSGLRFAELPADSKIGTSSVRRAAQLRRLRPAAQIEPMRGNLDTRLRKLREGPLDAIVLAAAGLHRMGWKEQITEYFSPNDLLPAVGQGALGIEARASDRSTLECLMVLEDTNARLAATAERALLRALGGGCQVPIAGYCQCATNKLTLEAIVIRPDGAELVHDSESIGAASLEAADDLGILVAERLLLRGARHILEDAK
jgi:hydroxymethylbilane synthase